MTYIYTFSTPNMLGNIWLKSVGLALVHLYAKMNVCCLKRKLIVFDKLNLITIISGSFIYACLFRHNSGTPRAISTKLCACDLLSGIKAAGV